MESYRQNELPETVRRYKKYTESFQEWLMKTAVQRGVENAALIAEHAKKRAENKKRKITTEEQEHLVNGIAGAGGHLDDTSGLRDLRDALHSRKEVSQFHKLQNTLDVGHSFFNAVLESAQSKLTALVQLIPAALKAHDLGDEASNFIFYHFHGEASDDSDDDIDHKAEASNHSDTAKQSKSSQQKPQPTPKKTISDNPLSKENAELQRDFLVLCFLYELNRVRGIIREVWVSYGQGDIQAITAALVTDLAQSHISQNVAALEEDLASYTSIVQLTIPEVIHNLYGRMSASAPQQSSASAVPQLSDPALRHLLCIDALDHIEAYLNPKSTSQHGGIASDTSTHPFLPFLLHFDAIRQKKVTLPIWDNFTEGMLRRSSKPDASLPFGFQMVLDVYEVTRDDEDHKIFDDIIGHGFDIAKMVRLHVDYEDRMWAAGIKPDYMSKGDMKFTNVYLSSLDKLLNFIQELLASTPGRSMNTDVFVTIHSTLAGLAMWNFNKTYHAFSIAKVRWFITALAHLYNAARQVGGLELEWNDLEYIIMMHGSERVFTGDRPTDPKDFYDRQLISSCVSSQVTAKDYKHIGGRAYPEVSHEAKKKRGLLAHFPLEDAINGYYGPDKNDDRWVRRHAVFNHLHHLSEHQVEGPTEDEIASSQAQLKELRNNFGSMANTMLPPKPKNRRKKATRASAPDFEQMEDTYAGLFLVMRSELEAHELHAYFDYLSFYRRTFALVLKVREQVLFDNALQVARRSDIHKAQSPDNQTLLGELFLALKIKPKDKKIKTTGEEVSTDVVPLDQLKRIAKIMEATIHEEGSVELRRAGMRLGREWEELKEEYDAEEACTRGDAAVPTDGEHNADPLFDPLFEAEEPLIEKEDGPSDVHETASGAGNEPPQLPPGHWPDEAGTGDCKTGTKDTKRSTIGVSIPSGNFLDEFGSVLGSDSDPEMEETTRLHRNPEGSSQKMFQAYVSDEAEADAGFWNEPPLDPRAVVEAIRVLEVDQEIFAASEPEVYLSTDDLVEVPFAEDPVMKVVEGQDNVKSFNIVSAGGRGKDRSKRKASSRLVETVLKQNVAPTLSRNIATMSDQKLLVPFDVRSILEGIAVADTEPESEETGVGLPLIVLPIEEVTDLEKGTGDYGSADQSASPPEPPKTTCPPSFKDLILRAAFDRPVIHHEDSPGKPHPVSITSMWLYSEIFQDIDSPPKNKPNFGKPKGIFHRLAFSSTPSRGRSAYLKRTSTTARLALAKHRAGCSPYFFGGVRKRTVAFICYARCSMACALLGKESRLQRCLRLAKLVMAGEEVVTVKESVEDVWEVEE